jgi:hypothetical protein
MEYDFVTSRLAIGTTPDAVSDLAPFTHVIDCRKEQDIAGLLVGSPYASRYLYAPTDDWVPLTFNY